jgi:quercetin dioxygenase-like cupin family protein
MLVVQISTVSRRQPPFPEGPTVATVILPGDSAQVAAVHVEIPAGSGLPEHDHGASEIVLIPLSGTAELRHDGQARALSAGMAAHVGRGERVSLANPGPEPASLMVVASPADFARHVATWPAT